MASDKKLRTLIAHSIKSADKSYFFENYTNQAEAVIRALAKAGYQIVPEDPTLYMNKAGVEAITLGKNRPQEMSEAIYRAMLMAAKRGDTKMHSK